MTPVFLLLLHFKVATSTWMANFIDLANLTRKDDRLIRGPEAHKKASEKFRVRHPPDIKKGNMFKFSFVRHPFERYLREEAQNTCPSCSSRRSSSGIGWNLTVIILLFYSLSTGSPLLSRTKSNLLTPVAFQARGGRFGTWLGRAWLRGKGRSSSLNILSAICSKLDSRNAITPHAKRMFTGSLTTKGHSFQIFYNTRKELHYQPKPNSRSLSLSLLQVCFLWLRLQYGRPSWKLHGGRFVFENNAQLDTSSGKYICRIKKRGERYQE